MLRRDIVMFLPDGARRGCGGRGRAVNPVERGLDELYFLFSPQDIETVGPGMGAEQMRVGFGHFFCLPQTEIHRATDFGQEIGPAEAATVCPTGEEGTEVTREAAIQAQRRHWGVEG